MSSPETVLALKNVTLDLGPKRVLDDLSIDFWAGHVDCKEIVQGDAVATAIPIVEVRHPKAPVTHEAAIGNVNSKQLETLMSRGPHEDQAVDLIIRGLLRR